MASKDKSELTVRPLKDASVLVVEDQNFVRDILERMLKERVGALHGAKTAEDAFYNLEKNPDLAHVAIVDYHLPGMNGLRFIEKLRSAKAPALRGLPVVVLTGTNNMELFRSAAKLGIAAFLIKPVAVATLVEALEGALTGRQVATPRLNADPQPPSGREVDSAPDMPSEEASQPSRKAVRVPSQPQAIDFKT